MYLLKMAFRNVWRNKRRTVLNLVAIAVNIAFIIFYVGLERGRIDKSYFNATKYLTAHIQIHNIGYEKEERKMPLDLTIQQPDEIISIIKKNPKVVSAGKRIEFGAFASNGKDQMPCQGVGLEPEEEAKFSMISRSIIKGRYITKNDKGILMGKNMAELLGVNVGDAIMMLARTKYGTPNLIDVEIVGIFSTGFPMIDKMTVFLPFNAAAEFLQMGNEPTEIIVGLTDRKFVKTTIQDINNRLPESVKKYISINKWEDYVKPMVADIKSDIAFSTIFMAILVAIAVFSMGNTMSMSIFERTKEIGTMRAVGTSKKQIISLFILESIIVSLVGVVIGCLAGGAISFYFQIVGIPISKFFDPDMMQVPIGNSMNSLVRPGEFIFSAILGILCGIFGGLAPALRASKLKVTDALREN